MNIPAVRATDLDMPRSIVQLLVLVLLMLMLLILRLLVTIMMTRVMIHIMITRIMIQLQTQYRVKEWCYEWVVDALFEAITCSAPPGNRDGNDTTARRGSADERLETEGTIIAAVRCLSNVCAPFFATPTHTTTAMHDKEYPPPPPSRVSLLTTATPLMTTLPPLRLPLRLLSSVSLCTFAAGWGVPFSLCLSGMK